MLNLQLWLGGFSAQLCLHKAFLHQRLTESGLQYWDKGNTCEKKGSMLTFCLMRICFVYSALDTTEGRGRKTD